MVTHSPSRTASRTSAQTVSTIESLIRPVYARDMVHPPPPHQPTDGSTESFYIGRGPEILATRFFFVLFLGAFLALLYLFWAFINDMILALLIAGLSYPLQRWLRPRLGGRRHLAAGLVTTLIVIIIAVPTSFLVTSLSIEAASAFETGRHAVTGEKVRDFLFGDSAAATYLRQMADYLGVEYTPESVRNKIASTATTVATFIGLQINVLLSNVLSGAFHFVIIVVFVFYLLLDGRRFKRFVFQLSPLPDEEEELLARKFAAVGKATLLGNGVGSLLQGVLGGAAMWAVGLPSPVLWGTIMTIFAFLPLVGISVVVIPATLYLLIDGQTIAAIAFFAFCGTQALIMENVVKTRLIGNHMKMHNLVIFMAIIGGIATFGVIGILYGPLIVVWFLTMCELYQRSYILRFHTDESRAELPADYDDDDHPI